MAENNSIVYNNNQETNEVAKEIHQLTGNQSDSLTDRILVVTADKEHVDSYFIQYAKMCIRDRISSEEISDERKYLLLFHYVKVEVSC